jgi:hypothetical protein
MMKQARRYATRDSPRSFGNSRSRAGPKNIGQKDYKMCIFVNAAVWWPVARAP